MTLADKMAENRTTPLYGLVLAGGESRRMGQDKVSLVYQGAPQLERAMNLLAELTEQAFISVRHKTQNGIRASYRQISDGSENVSDGSENGKEVVKGPAAGLLAAHAAFPAASWLVLACDLPFLDRSSLAYLVQSWQKEGFGGGSGGVRDAVSFRSSYDGLPEPLCAIWTPPALARLEKSVAEGRICPRHVLKNDGILMIEPVTQEALGNINTMEERREALRKFGPEKTGKH